MHAAKFTATLSAACVALAATVPAAVRDATKVALFFVILDTLTGVWVAIVAHQVSSKRATEKLVTKLTQYAILVGLGAGLSVLMHVDQLILSAIWAIIAIETLSLIENLAKLEAAGGVKLGPAEPLFRRIVAYMGINAQMPEQKEKDTK